MSHQHESASSKAPSSSSFFDTSQWIKGAWYRALQPLVEKVTSITAINTLAENSDSPGISADEFSKELLAGLGVQWATKAVDLPKPDGRGTLVLANHPSGFIEGLVLMRILHELSPDDSLLLANQFIAQKEQFSKHVLALDPFNSDGASRMNRNGLRQAAKCLRRGGVVGAFPAGRVSARRDAAGASLDQPWSMHFLRLAKATNSHIVIARMPWQSGLILRALPVQIPALRALFLSQEAFRHSQQPQEVILTSAPDQLATDPQKATSELQKFCHGLHTA